MDYYCEKVEETGECRFFFKNATAVRMCGVKKSNIVKVQVQEIPEEEEGLWAYHDLISGDYPYIFSMKEQVQMCSPYSFKSEIEKGIGKIVKVIIEEVKGIDE